MLNVNINKHMKKIKNMWNQRLSKIESLCWLMLVIISLEVTMLKNLSKKLPIIWIFIQLLLEFLMTLSLKVVKSSMKLKVLIIFVLHKSKTWKNTFLKTLALHFSLQIMTFKSNWSKIKMSILLRCSELLMPRKLINIMAILNN